MKNLIIIATLLLTAGAVHSQTCSELFFSEYSEGSSNNKYYEIYNPTSNTISLSGYSVSVFSNGSTTAGNSSIVVGYSPGNNLFVVEPFTFNLSANVAIDTDESATAMAVATASSKGSKIFAGSSEGGSVGVCLSSEITDEGLFVEADASEPAGASGCDAS